MLQVFLDKGNAYELLTHTVKQVWEWNALPEISRSSDGKPVFVKFPDRHFNVSHSEGLALVALSDSPVGADIEFVRPRREGLPAYVFKGKDYERFQALGGDWNAFYTLWTELESIIKYTGEGLRAYRCAALPEDCVLTNFRGEGWRAAVCGHEKAELHIL